MKKPELILFDYGHTLGFEEYFNSVQGMEAVLKHAVNPADGLAPEAAALAESLFTMGHQARSSGMEIHNQHIDRFVYEYLGIKLSISPEEAEAIFWDAASPVTPMPGTADMLDYLADRGIRTGVISNISFSGTNLTRRINHILPNNRFEFIIATSDYALRKPNPLLFELALRKAGVSAGDAWYCGDSLDFDIPGALAAGMHPVWYHTELPCYYRKESDFTAPECGHLYIRHWAEFITALEQFTD